MCRLKGGININRNNNNNTIQVVVVGVRNGCQLEDEKAAFQVVTND